MQDDNPYESPKAADVASGHSSSGQTSRAREAYNIVADTVTGLNVRKSDNKFQAIFILVSVLVLAALGAGVAALVGEPWLAGAMTGAFAGLVLGLFASGFVLMVYRTIRHMQGKHD